MTGTEVALIITSLATLVTAVGAVVIGVRNSGKISDVKRATDGMKDQLVAATQKSAFAEGQKQEVDDEAGRVSERKARGEPC
jgi:hypothetical protein